MLNAFIVGIIVAGFVWWDFLLVFSFAFKSKKAAIRDCLRFEAKALHLISAAFFAYRGGFRLHIQNRVAEPLPDRFLIIANHQSILDIVMIMYNMPVKARARFVAKMELSYGVPLISTLLRRLGHALVRRKGDPLQAMRAVEKFAHRCKADGNCPAIFPEGTRSRTGELGTFHSAGVRKILEVEKLPILVIAVDGGWRVASLKDFFRKFGTTPYYMRYVALLPAPQDKRQTLEAIEESRTLIASALADLRKNYP